MMRSLARRQAKPADAPTEQPAPKRKRRTLEDLYRALDENLAILD